MWKYSAISVRGTAHVTNDTPCQDSCGTLLLGDVLIVALSDGAGSAQHSQHGSFLTISRALDFFRGLLEDNPEAKDLLLDLDESDGRQMLLDIRGDLEAAARLCDTTIAEFACTMLVGVFHESISLFFQIGDGVWCGSINNVLGAITWPLQGEFVGQTDFVTSKTAAASLQFAKISGRLDFAVGMTDGMERLALDLQRRLAHPGFCEPLIKGMLLNATAASFDDQLKIFLESERVTQRTDDDKTLALVAYVDDL